MDTIALLRSLSGLPPSAVEHGSTYGYSTDLMMRCELVVDDRRDDPIALIDHEGSGDSTTVLYFQRYLEWLQAGGVRRMVLDFVQTMVSSSLHLGTMVNIADSFDESPEMGPLVICSVHPMVQVIFDMLGLSAFFNLVPDRAAALALHGLERSPLPALEPLLARACAAPAAALAALDALRERGHAIAELLDDLQLRFESIRQGPVRVADAPRARLIVPLGARYEAVLAPAEA